METAKRQSEQNRDEIHKPLADPASDADRRIEIMGLNELIEARSKKNSRWPRAKRQRAI